MVTVTGYQTKITPEGEMKVYLKVEGGMKAVISQNSGRAYFKTLRAKVFAAIDEEVAKEMVGFQLPGTIQQMKVEPYEIYDQQTGEVKVLDYQNVYITEEGEV
jgi:hypothetical protein